MKHSPTNYDHLDPDNQFFPKKTKAQLKKDIFHIMPPFKYHHLLLKQIETLSQQPKPITRHPEEKSPLSHSPTYYL